MSFILVIINWQNFFIVFNEGMIQIFVEHDESGYVRIVCDRTEVILGVVI